MTTVISTYIDSLQEKIINLIPQLPSQFIVFNADQPFKNNYSTYFIKLFNAIKKNVMFYAIGIDDLENILILFNVLFQEYFVYFQNYFILLKNDETVTYLTAIIQPMNSLILLLKRSIQNFRIYGNLISIEDNTTLNSLILQIQNLLNASNPLDYNDTFSNIEETNNKSILLYPPALLNTCLAVESFFQEQDPDTFCTNINIISYKPFSIIKKPDDLLVKKHRNSVSLLHHCKNLWQLSQISKKDKKKNYNKYMFVLAELVQKKQDFNFNLHPKETVGILIHADKWEKQESKWTINYYDQLTKPFEKKVLIVS
jgi:hypothetical protein